jgi:hypothetical protein
MTELRAERPMSASIGYGQISSSATVLHMGQDGIGVSVATDLRISEEQCYSILDRINAIDDRIRGGQPRAMSNDDKCVDGIGPRAERVRALTNTIEIALVSILERL